MSKYDITSLEKGCKELGIELSEQQVEQFLKFYELLVEWNKVMNLTGITEYEEVISKHFLDSLLLVKAYDMNSVESIIDIGTGAGFPGIPLKIAFPEKKFVLLDSLGKRIKFLEAVVDNLGLDQIELIHGRAEDYAKKQEYRENFDLAVSRAVANLASLSEYCIPFVKVKGAFIPYKSGSIEEELKQSEKAVSILGGKRTECKELLLPDTDITRSFVLIEKVKSTAKKYPRKAGLPTKEPLG
jgi:16S rRNA (guanine527-N7)-methyltransferase